MKNLHKLLAVLVGTIFLSQNVFAQSIVPMSTGSQTVTSGSGLTVELQGRVEASIVSVIIPTQVKFAVIPETEGWNKILSPDFNIRNVGNVMLDVSISKAELTTSGIEFTSNAPILNNGVKQVRIGVAPKEDYPSIVRVRDYLFTDSVSDSKPIILMEGLDYSPTNDTGTFNIYGDISSGWADNDEFSIATVFRVSLK